MSAEIDTISAKQKASYPTESRLETVGASSDPKPLVLITGSSGLIGSRLIEALVGDFRVVGIDQKPPKEQLADFIECDLTRTDSVKSALHDVEERHGDKIASVIHLAAYYDFSGEPSPLYDKLTVAGTRRLLQQLQRFAVEQFVFSSSLLVMKPVAEGEMITETSPVESTWDYPESKIKAEEVIRQEHREIPVVVLRIAGVYDEDCHSIPIAQQISRIYEKTLESYFFPGDASHGQAFVHLDDLVDCFRNCIERRRQLGSHELILIAEPDVMSYAELQDRLGELLHGKEWPTIRIPKVAAKAGAWVQEKLAGEEEETFIKPWMIDFADAHYPVQIDRARQRLGWEPKRRLRDTLDEMVRRLKRSPKGWYERNSLPAPES
ncbi:MAG: NAD(P)-dependent oxidoreductase [Pirellulales bacterium]